MKNSGPDQAEHKGGVGFLDGSQHRLPDPDELAKIAARATLEAALDALPSEVPLLHLGPDEGPMYMAASVPQPSSMVLLPEYTRLK